MQTLLKPHQDARDDREPTSLDVALRINGREHRLRLDTRTTLLDALREHLALTGP